MRVKLVDVRVAAVFGPSCWRLASSFAFLGRPAFLRTRDASETRHTAPRKAEHCSTSSRTGFEGGRR
eukprot:1798581-Alexandrium_andersonii.AAC.1